MFRARTNLPWIFAISLLWIAEYGEPVPGVDKPAGAAGTARRQLQVTQAARVQVGILKYHILHFE